MAKKEIHRPCECPNCPEEGSCRAPKTRELKEYYWFCAKHAAEYNKSWDYLGGLSPDEIEAQTRADETWGERTFKFGLGIKDLHKVIEDPLGLYSDLVGLAKPKTVAKPKYNAEQLKAIKTLELTLNFTKKQLRDNYKRLAKLYHPDINSTTDAEDKFKEISAAYRELASANT